MKLYHPEATGCSVQGKSYTKGADGSFEVDEAHAPHLEEHGFTTEVPEAEVEPQAAKRGRPKKVEV